MITDAVTSLPADAEAQRVRHLAEATERRRRAIALCQTGKTPELQEAEQAQLMEQLRQAVEYGKQLADEYESRIGGVNRAIQERLALQLQIRNAHSELKAWQKPLPPTSFPSAHQLKKQDEQVAIWTRILEDLHVRLEDARRREGDALECARLKNALENQRYVVRNLESLITEGTRWRGELSKPEGFALS